jgi:APA family basic amino acid/polyamine antiporter
MGASTVSSGWSSYFIEFLKMFGIKLPLWISYDHWTGLAVAKETAARELLAVTHPELVSGSQGFLNALQGIMSSPSAALMARAHQLLNAPHFFGMEIGFNLPAFLIAMVITTILVIGIKQSAKFNTGIVIVKVSVVLFVLALGSFYVHPANWGHDWHSFAPMGLAGIGTAAGYIFFAYIGFDAVSTTAQEAKNPQRDLPIGIIASLTICTILYIGIAAVLTGMVPWQLVNIGAPISYAFLDHNIFWASNIITCGALAGLTSVMLVMLIGQTRVLYAMASDGLLPKTFFGAIHHKFHTPWKNTILVGLLAASVGSITPIDKIGKMVNIGTLLAFVMVCASIIVLRIKAPDQPRPFHTPGIFFKGWLPLVPGLGILVNGYLMCSLGWENWARLIIWLAIGLVVYFTYSVNHSKVQKLSRTAESE